jgi:hypothetical protein
MSALLPSSPAEVWGRLQRLYPIYSTLAREFAIDTEPCLDLEEALQVPSAEAIENAENWFAKMDDEIRIQHLRQFVQTSSRLNTGVLRDLLVHSVDKKKRTRHDRDKVDFLLVQFLAEQAPANISEADLTLEAAGKLLEPLFGTIDVQQPEFLNDLDALLDEAKKYKTLNSLFTARIIERGRQLKESCGDKFFDPVTMVAFGRWSRAA